MTRRLIFVYNADSGLFNTLTDMAHKLFSPDTYSCNLCALTNSHLGMRSEWKQFIQTLDHPVEFLHADEFRKRHGETTLSFPIMLANDDGRLSTLVDAEVINSCASIAALQDEITRRLQ